MKNIDKIRAMSVEDLAKWKRKRTCDSGCVYELACDGGVCDGNRCLEGLIKWLNQEVNPMPELKIGDLITFSNKKEVIYFGDDFVWSYLSVNGITLTNMCDVDYKRIISIKRVDNTKMVKEIWRAKNGN